MHALWATLGIVVLGLGLVDIFLTALDYDESGFISTRLCALQWRCIRVITRRLPRRWRPVALRQVTGLNIILSMTILLGTVIVGYGLVYYSQMYGTNFQYDGRNIDAGFFSAMYFSAGQLSTVGASQISPETNALRALSILETLTGVGLVTLILTFLFGVYQVVRDLRALSSNFITGERDVDDPVVSLGPFLSQGETNCLDNHLRSISESFWSYANGLRQHHLAYYFQSGQDHFSLPYVLHMLGHWLAALRWGLPAGHPVTVQPLLTQLSFQFEQFAGYLQSHLCDPGAAEPEVVPFERFSMAYRAGDATSGRWLDRFLRLNRDMARLARLDLAVDPQEAYRRYQQWLSFAYRAEQIMTAVSRDLDYQPTVHVVGQSCRGIAAANGSGRYEQHG
jgi:Ion channel